MFKEDLRRSAVDALSRFTRVVPSPLHGTLKPLRKEKDDTSHPEWRSGVPGKEEHRVQHPNGQSAEYRLLEVVDELREVRKVEVVEENMKAYLDM